ncbi:MAG: cell division protein FtsQ/DivIB [Rhodocyclaceae bacterium]|nr:cell division protein FtsQ/DivIB [Rhodocyclaceae bacterium]MBR4736834.1 cell division protein FtsQ/DivIB [Rhodocyclaceae bacterium]
MVIDYRHYGRPAPAPAPVSFWHRPRRMNAVANLLYVLAGVLAGYAGMMWFLAQPYLSLQEVVVHRKLEHVTREQIEGVVRLCVRQRNFLLTDVDALRTAFERLPWVKQASVRRRWPGVLDVHLQEYRPVAYWTQQGSEDTQMLDEHGTLFPGASNEALPMLSGPAGAEPDVWQRYIRFSAQLAAAGLHIRRLSLSARHAWQVELDNGMMLVLGREQDKLSLEARLNRFVQAWPQVVSRFSIPVATADLRYLGGFALTPQVAPVSPKTVKGTRS